MTVGKGEPLAEQLTRTGSRILDTEIEDGGVVENIGSSEAGKLVANVKTRFCEGVTS